MEKFVLVTGASGGIGCAIVDLLAKNDYTIIAQFNNNIEPLQELANTYKDKIIPIKGDLSTLNGCKDFLVNISAYKNISILINAHGISLTSPLQDFSDSDIYKLIETNLTSTIMVTKHISANMIKRRCGKIVNISSIWGVFGGSCEVVYSASKGGLISFTKALSRELGLSNINVNCIAPGLIDTNMNKNLSDEEKQSFIDTLSIPRIGTAIDVANLVLFLIDDKSSYITGQTINIDGGL